jgi:hypothetical protein
VSVITNIIHLIHLTYPFRLVSIRNTSTYLIITINTFPFNYITMSSTTIAILVACAIVATIAQPLPSSSSAGTCCLCISCNFYCFHFYFAAPAVFSCEGLSTGQHAAAVNACESYFYQVCLRCLFVLLKSSQLL